MMRTPTESQLAHLYDPAKAHDYYEKHKHLKGRHKGSGQPPPTGGPRGQHANPRAKQKAELAAHIQTLELKLHNLEALIRKKEAVLKKDQASAKVNAKKNSAAKAKGPKTAAEKAKAARDAKKFRQKHHQQLKNKAKQAAAKGGHGHKGKKDAQRPIAELKALATKVKGQLAMAKQKLAAL